MKAQRFAKPATPTTAKVCVTEERLRANVTTWSPPKVKRKIDCDDVRGFCDLGQAIRPGHRWHNRHHHKLLIMKSAAAGLAKMLASRQPLSPAPWRKVEKACIDCVAACLEQDRHLVKNKVFTNLRSQSSNQSSSAVKHSGIFLFFQSFFRSYFTFSAITANTSFPVSPCHYGSRTFFKSGAPFTTSMFLSVEPKLQTIQYNHQTIHEIPARACNHKTKVTRRSSRSNEVKRSRQYAGPRFEQYLATPHCVKVSFSSFCAK